MKTTIDLADDLAATLKKTTAREGISMRAVVHDALRLWLKSHPATPAAPAIAPSVGLMSGQGLIPEAEDLSWSDLRALSYDRRG